MITTFFLTIFFSLLSLFVNFLPTGDLPAGIAEGLAYFWGILNTFNYIFPISTLLTILLIVLSFNTAFWVWGLINWIYHKIRG